MLAVEGGILTGTQNYRSYSVHAGLLDVLCTVCHAAGEQSGDRQRRGLWKGSVAPPAACAQRGSDGGTVDRTARDWRVIAESGSGCVCDVEIHFWPDDVGEGGAPHAPPTNIIQREHHKLCCPPARPTGGPARSLAPLRHTAQYAPRYDIR